MPVCSCRSALKTRQQRAPQKRLVALSMPVCSCRSALQMRLTTCAAETPSGTVNACVCQYMTTVNAVLHCQPWRSDNHQPRNHREHDRMKLNKKTVSNNVDKRGDQAQFHSCPTRCWSMQVSCAACLKTCGKCRHALKGVAAISCSLRTIH